MNFEPDRWPCGNPETGYLNVDASPTKSVILHQNRNGTSTFWDLSFGKRPAEELYHIKDDPDCLNNLIDDNDVQDISQQMSALLIIELESSELG